MIFDFYQMLIYYILSKSKCLKENIFFSTLKN